MIKDCVICGCEWDGYLMVGNGVKPFCMPCADEIVRMRGEPELIPDHESPEFPGKKDSYWEVYQKNIHAEREMARHTKETK